MDRIQVLTSGSDKLSLAKERRVAATMPQNKLIASIIGQGIRVLGLHIRNENYMLVCIVPSGMRQNGCCAEK